MDITQMEPATRSPEAQLAVAPAIGREQVLEFTRILQDYKAGKAHTDQRIKSAENWWKIRNSTEEQGFFGGKSVTKEQAEEQRHNPNFKAKSGWLHNVIVSKHADGMESYPEPVFLPRQADDEAEARRLSSIMPVIFDQNDFEHTYSMALWDKFTYGTAIYKMIWDPSKLGGIGDISIGLINPLSLFWTPGINNIQDSRYVFQVELVDKDIAIMQHPELRTRATGNAELTAKFSYDDSVSTDNKLPQIEVYYHKPNAQGQMTLQYCKFIADVVLEATENDPVTRETGLYDHGKFPYVFDRLYPIKGSPCGYGYVDVGKNPQTIIDFLNTSFVKSARMGASPRVFSTQDAQINMEEFCDPDCSVVHVSNLNDLSVKLIEHHGIDGAYLNLADAMINELRETTGNTDASTGNAPSGVTAASAIAALQQASGKGSRDSTKGSHYATKELAEIGVELERQFGVAPRSYRIKLPNGQDQFVSYDNRGLQPQPQVDPNGVPIMSQGGVPATRTPLFDIKIEVQRKTTYTRIAQNELAIQFYQLGLFNPQMVDQAIMCVGMMDFDGKDELLQKLQLNGAMAQKLMMYQQMAMLLAQKAMPQLVPQIQQDMAGGGMAPVAGGEPAQPIPGVTDKPQNPAGANPDEAAHMKKARAQTDATAQV